MLKYNLVCFDKSKMFWPFLDREVSLFSLYKGTNKKRTFFRRLFNLIISNSPFAYFYFSSWFSYIKKPNNVFVFFDECQFGPFLRIIINKYRDRCIIHLSNPTPEIKNLKKIFKCKCNIYSFSKSDCKKYHLKFKPCIMPNILSFDIKNSKPKYDLYFIGQNKKGRKEILDRIKNKYPNVVFKIDLLEPGDFVSYEEFIKRECEAKCILEILQLSQKDETLRPVEAMALRKKLITNNKYLVDIKSTFGNNLLVIDENNLPSEKEIVSFINEQFSDASDDYVRQHSIPFWFEDIDFKKEVS